MPNSFINAIPANPRPVWRKTRNHILIVEDSITSAFILRSAIENDLHFETTVARTFQQAKKLIEYSKTPFTLAVIGLILPDDFQGRIVDYISSRGIPTMVFTGAYKDEVRDQMLAKSVADYFVKENPDIVNSIVASIHRHAKNRDTKVLVVEDSVTSRLFIKQSLERHKFRVYEAADGMSAMRILKKHPDTKVVITDYTMPKMDGFGLVTEIRKKYDRNSLAIIGLSAQEEEALSVKFLKKGANDFLKKPFLPEELYCRVVQNVEIIEQIQELKEASNTDFLTKLYNRRFFHLISEEFHKNALRGSLSFALAIVDIDDFKKINDTYGHDTGDIVLKKLADLLCRNLRESDIVCRYGGEEFCILLNNAKIDQLPIVLEKIRKLIEGSVVSARHRKIRLTVSIGATVKLEKSFELMMQSADKMLYEAKQLGKNRVVIDFGI